MIRWTNRWRGVSAFALLAAGVGVVAGSQAVLLVAVVGVGFAAYAHAATPPAAEVELSRTLSTTDPDPGEDVEVTVTVENAGDGLLADLRVVDGVPDALGVTAGSPRFGTALRAGKRAQFSYTVEATHGEHTFDPATVVARDASGAIERELTVEAETTLTCAPPLERTADVPLRAQTTQYTGRVTTDVGGTGVEFYSTREYRPGDPLSRIDWNRRARTGDLTTVEFREERAATVVVVIDAREAAYRAGPDDEVSAVARAVVGAGAVAAALLDTGDRVGIAALSPEECWLAPGAGKRHQARVRTVLASNPALAFTPPEGTFYPTLRTKWLRRRLPADAQVVFFSPMCDDYAPEVARRLDAAGHRVTVVSPDPTGTATTGQRLASAERRGRLHDLRRNGLRAVDWDTDTSLGVALARAGERWSP